MTPTQMADRLAWLQMERQSTAPPPGPRTIPWIERLGRHLAAIDAEGCELVEALYDALHPEPADLAPVLARAVAGDPAAIIEWQECGVPE